MLSAVVLLLHSSISRVEAATYPLPMTLDFAMMDALVIANYYTDPGEKAIVVDGEEGCTSVVLSGPEFSRKDGKLTFETRIRVQGGKKFFGYCFTPVRWEGYLTLTQKPVLNPDKWSLSFEIADIKLMSLKRKPVKVAGLIWKIIKGEVTSYLSDIESTSLFLNGTLRSSSFPCLPIFSPMKPSSLFKAFARVPFPSFRTH